LSTLLSLRFWQVGRRSGGDIPTGAPRSVPEGEGSVCRRTLTLWGAAPGEVVTIYREGNRAIFEQHLREYLERGKGLSAEYRRQR
jgi:hypothetical protein